MPGEGIHHDRPLVAAGPAAAVAHAARTATADPAAWEHFMAHALPAALRHKTATDPVRAWVPCCGDGTAFGVALGLLHEARRRHLRGPIRVIGSDGDGGAVRCAREGRAPRAAVLRFPPAWGASAHFTPCDEDTLLASDALRRHLVFTQHQPGWDPPFVQLDLVFCAGLERHTARLRERLAEHFWFALRDEAVLWLADTELAIDVGRFDRLPGTARGFLRLNRQLSRPALDELVTDVVTNERQRLGQELHDTVGQHVSAASLLVHRLRRRAGADHDEVLGELERTLAAARSDLRAISRGRLPVEVVNGDLPGALRDMLDGLRRVLPAEIREASEGAFDWIDPPSASHLLRIAQEAVRNAATGGAKRVQVSLRDDDAELRLEVCDDGPGLRCDDGSSHEGLGLRIMRDRARMLGAALRFEVGAEGTAVVCCIGKR